MQPPDQPAGIETARELLGLFDASPTPYHCVRTVAGLLGDAGFAELAASDEVPRAGACFVRSGGALVAWELGEHHHGAASLRAVGAHTDSPNLRLKPNPDSVSAGWRQLGVEVYGGALLNSWLDRELGLAGRVVLRNGADGAGGPETGASGRSLDAGDSLDGLEARLFEDRRPILRLPQLAIHLDREIAAKGLLLDRQRHMAPVWGVGHGAEFADYLADLVGAAPSDIVAFEAMAFDLAPATLAGIDSDFLVSGRIDNQLSCFLAARALIAVRGEALDHVPMICLFDHEEVGSVSASGAASPLLAGVIERIEAACESTAAQRSAARSRSLLVSADGAHATHPNYPEAHEPQHRIAVNAGPVLKVNASQRYATDALSGAAFRLACERAGVPLQTFVSRGDMPCGSTIGPVAAGRLGIAVVDAGCAQLAMHSAREMSGSHDPAMFEAALIEVFRG